MGILEIVKLIITICEDGRVSKDEIFELLCSVYEYEVKDLS